MDPAQYSAAREVFDRAGVVEEGVTTSMREIVGGVEGSELIGLEHRLKLHDRFMEKLAIEVRDFPERPIEVHLANQKDSLRYTIQSEDASYVANVNHAIDELTSRGYENVKFKNFWGQDGGYQGINSFWCDPATGHVFEVQFHTPSSFEAKMENHPIYEDMRAPETSPERVLELERQQAEIFDAVPRPPGSAEIHAPSDDVGATHLPETGGREHDDVARRGEPQGYPDSVRPADRLVERVQQLIDEFRGAEREPAEVAGDHVPRGDADRAADHQSLFDGTDMAPEERQALREFWDDLTPAEREYLYRMEPMFGERAELPVEVCDHYARRAAQDLLDTTTDPQQRRALENILESVEERPRGPRRFLIGFEQDGRSITSVGNPDTATRTVVFAPGTFTDHTRLNPHTTESGIPRPGYMEVSRRIHEALTHQFGDHKVAVVDYQNYHAPQSLRSLTTGAANPRFAQDGAAALRNHCDRLQHTNQGGDHTLWVLGHSYGTVLVGEAAKGHHGLNADGIISLGSPGLRVDDVSGLQLKGQRLVPGDAPVHTMTRSDDMINVVDLARVSGLAIFGVGHGLMPHHLKFGGYVWDVNGAPHPDAHSSYFDEDSPALSNIAKILAGQHPPPAPAELPPWRMTVPPALIWGDDDQDDRDRASRDRLVADYEAMLTGEATAPVVTGRPGDAPNEPGGP